MNFHFKNKLNLYLDLSWREREENIRSEDLNILYFNIRITLEKTKSIHLRSY